MPRSEVQNSLLAAFCQEFQGDLAILRREWDAYKPTRRTKLTDLPELRRILHTIKGSTRLLDFPGVPEMVHDLEEMVLTGLRKKKKPAEFVDALAALEEEVARHVGMVERSIATEAVEATGISSWASGASEIPVSAAYGFLLSVDELLSMSQAVVRAGGTARLAQQRAGPLAHQAALLAERSRALRNEARRMSLMPSADLFLGMTEFAGRTASDNGKSVRVTHNIEKDRLEPDVVLGLRPALLQLVGNAVSHGVASGSGEITFGFCRETNGLVVWVADDGPGVDREALGRTVIQGGHLTAKAWNALGESEQLQWIFHPGLSTRSEADLSAGRGMGLAVVAETARRLGGRVEVRSSGRGTEFRLLIPANWNLRAVLRVSSGALHFAVLSAELEGVQASALEVETTRCVGDLADLLGYTTSGQQGDYGLLLRTRRGEMVSVAVDYLGDFDDVLVTPLSGFSGLPAALVGSTPFQGVPIPVVSPRALLEDPSLPQRSQAPLRKPAGQGSLILVVDDSLPIRSLVSGILDSSGFRVIAAADGQQGLSMASTEGLAGIVCDLHMPVLDGLGFLERLRENPITATIPFILLTSIDDLENFEKASALGADRCLGKQHFSQELLLKMLRELL